MVLFSKNQPKDSIESWNMNNIDYQRVSSKPSNKRTSSKIPSKIVPNFSILDSFFSEKKSEKHHSKIWKNRVIISTHKGNGSYTKYPKILNLKSQRIDAATDKNHK
jgi:hypothetical protein